MAFISGISGLWSCHWSAQGTHRIRPPWLYRYCSRAHPIARHLHPAKNAINVCCSDASIFLETFLNVPLSIYVLLNKLGIILHCSSVFKDKMVYAFSGKKGIGKSSILQTFLKLDDLGYDFFSDDTIRLKTLAQDIPDDYQNPSMIPFANMAFMIWLIMSTICRFLSAARLDNTFFF